MCTIGGKQIAVVLVFAFVLSVLFETVQSVPVNKAVIENDTNSYPIVYKRYVRRRPSQYPSDLYMDEYMEVFHLRQRPPPYMLSDEDVDRMIRCDFDPTLKECKPLAEPKFPQPPPIGWHIPSTPTKPTTTTSSVRTTPKPHTLLSTTTEDLPFLPDIPESKEDTTSVPILLPETTTKGHEAGPAKSNTHVDGALGVNEEEAAEDNAAEREEGEEYNNGEEDDDFWRKK